LPVYLGSYSLSRPPPLLLLRRFNPDQYPNSEIQEVNDFLEKSLKHPFKNQKRKKHKNKSQRGGNKNNQKVHNNLCV
jgi:hypothetical protein